MNSQSKRDQSREKQLRKDMENKEKRDKELQENLDQVCDVKLLRREVIVIHNILSSLQYKLGDAEVVLKILAKLAAHAAVDTNISEESHNHQVEEARLELGKKAN
jgi:hypothetical protein